MRGPGMTPSFDRIPQRHVVVAGALGLQVPHGREAVLEADLQRPHRPRDAVGRVLLEDLLVVLDGGRVALEQDVGMGVDQARKKHAVAEVDDARAGGRGGADAFDPIPHDDDDGSST